MNWGINTFGAIPEQQQLGLAHYPGLGQQASLCALNAQYDLRHSAYADQLKHEEIALNPLDER
jgi:hypothetical protein